MDENLTMGTIGDPITRRRFITCCRSRKESGRRPQPFGLRSNTRVDFSTTWRRTTSAREISGAERSPQLSKHAPGANFRIPTEKPHLIECRIKAMRRNLCLLLSVLMGSPLFVSQTALAEEHLVSPVELRQRLRAAVDSREQKLARFYRLLSNDAVGGALQSARIDTGQVRQAAAMLTDDELSRLATRADRVERDLAAGALSNQELTYIVIALVTAVVVIVILKA